MCKLTLRLRAHSAMRSSSPCPSFSPAEACEEKVAQVTEDARLKGVTDLEAAEANLVSHENDQLEKPDLDEQYVEVAEKLRQLRYMRDEGGALMSAAPSNVGIHLAGAANDESAHSKLTKKLSRLASDIAGMPMDGWERESERYKAGLAKGRQRAIVRCQQAAENQVFKYRMILQNLARVESGKNGSKLKKSATKAKT